MGNTSQHVNFWTHFGHTRPRDIVLIVNVSGGKDSSAMLHWLRHKYPTLAILAIYADTGFDHVKPISAEAFARGICDRLGIELHVVRNPNKTLLQMVEHRGKFPAPAVRQCTSDLKRDPVNTWIRRAVRSGVIKQKIVINCTGIRADESRSRAKQRPLKRNARLCKAGRTVWDWSPIFTWTLQQVLDYHTAHDLPLHPVYVWAGGYLRRLSCRVCIFMGAEDLRAVHIHDREAFELIAALENKIGFTMKPEGNLHQIASLQR